MSSIKIGQGHVYHSRFETTANAFRYPTFFAFLDCEKEAEINQLLRQKFFGLFSINAKDYLHRNLGSLSTNIKNFLRTSCHYNADCVRLHTMPRMFGYAFNPVSFWCCYKNENLDAVLVEVHNTFGERHFYWLNPKDGIQTHEWYSAEKVFHVSPFLPVDGFYKFHFHIDDQMCAIDINYYAPDGKLRLKTGVSGRLSLFANQSFTGLLMKYGWITPMVVLRIHYQAFKLWLKRVRFYSKPSLPQQEIT